MELQSEVSFRLTTPDSQGSSQPEAGSAAGGASDNRGRLRVLLPGAGPRRKSPAPGPHEASASRAASATSATSSLAGGALHLQPGPGRENSNAFHTVRAWVRRRTVSADAQVPTRPQHAGEDASPTSCCAVAGDREEAMHAYDDGLLSIATAREMAIWARSAVGSQKAAGKRWSLKGLFTFRRNKLRPRALISSASQILRKRAAEKGLPSGTAAGSRGLAAAGEECTSPSLPPPASPIRAAPTGPAPAGRGSAQAAGPAAGPPAPPAPPTLLGRDLHVQVVCARNVRAADLNGLSDPYCVVRVAGNKAHTRVISCTLSPRWNETFVFAAEDVADALASARPFIMFEVWDSDYVGQDFLGQAALDLRSDGLAAAPPREPRWLALSAASRGGKLVAGPDQLGHLQVAAWLAEPAGAAAPAHAARLTSEDGQPATQLSSLCAPAGAEKSMPAVVHMGGNTLYEEPCLAYLAFTLCQVRGVVLGDSSSGAPMPAAVARSPRTSLHRHTRSGNGGLLSRIRARGRAAVARLGSPDSGAGPEGDSPTASGGLPADEDVRDSLADTAASLSFAARSDTADSEGAHQELPAASGASFSADPFALWDNPDDMASSPGAELEGSSRRASGRLGSGELADSGLGRSTAGQELATASSLESPSTDGKGKRVMLYCKVVLGHQQHTSHIKPLMGDSATWHQRLAFACPVPLRNRPIKVELWQTSSRTRRGRLVAHGSVPLASLLDGDQPTAAAGAGGAPPCSHWFRLHSDDKLGLGRSRGILRLALAVVDADPRRAMYRQPLLDPGFRRDVLRSSPTPPDRAALLGTSQEAEGSGGTGLPRTTSVDLDCKPARQASLGALPGGVWGRLSSSPARLQSALSSLSFRRQAGGAGEGSLATPSFASELCGQQARRDAHQARPLGVLKLVLQRVQVDALPSGAAAVTNCFCVLKCGPHWGRTATLAPGPDGFAWHWEVHLPVYEPGAVLLLAAYSQAGQVLRARRAASSAPAALVGKLRVRLSTLVPGAQVAAALPLLSERKAGCSQVGSAHLQAQVHYFDQVELWKSYVRAPLPGAAYEAGLDQAPARAVLAHESKSITLQWLDLSHPAIPRPVARSLLDEQDTFYMSRARANWRRLGAMRRQLGRLGAVWGRIKSWEDPALSAGVMATLVAAAFWPSVAGALLFTAISLASLAMASQAQTTPRPPAMEADPPDAAAEDEDLAASNSSNPAAALRRKYQRLLAAALRAQNAVDAVASQLERVQALVTWQDPTASLLFLLVCAALAAGLALLGLPALLALAAAWMTRPPRLRNPTPPAPLCFFLRLPSRADQIM